MAAIDRDLLAATGRSRPRVAILPTASWPDGELGLPGLARAGAGPLLRRSAPRSRALSCARGPTPSTRHAPRPSARPTWSTCPAGSPTTCSRCSRGHRPPPPCGPSICGAASWSGAQRERWFSPAGSPASAAAASCASPAGWRDALGFVEGVAVLPHYDALPEPLAALHRPRPAAPGGGPGDRRGDRGHRARRDVAGPRPWTRHGLAGSFPRAASRRRDLPPRRGPRGPVRRGAQPALTARKQSEQ